MPGSVGLPIIGELIDFLLKREEYYWQKYQQYGNVFKTSSLSFIFKRAACLVGPDANRLLTLPRL
jgi:retinoid hydroxylase